MEHVIAGTYVSTFVLAIFMVANCWFAFYMFFVIGRGALGAAFSVACFFGGIIVAISVICFAIAWSIAGTLGASVVVSAAIGGVIFGAVAFGKYDSIFFLNFLTDLFVGILRTNTGDMLLSNFVNCLVAVTGGCGAAEFTADLEVDTIDAKGGYHEAISRARYFIGIITVMGASTISYDNLSMRLG